VRLGALRQIGRQLQRFDKNDPALKDIFLAVIHSAKSPYMVPVLYAAIASDPKHQMIWKVVGEIFNVFDHASSVEIANMKQIVFYFLANSNRLEEWVPTHETGNQTDLLDRVLWRAQEILTDYREFLVKPEVDFLGDVMTSKTLSSFALATYDNKDKDRSLRLRDQLVDFLKDNAGDRGVSRVHNLMNILKSVYENDQSRDSLKSFQKRLDTVMELEEYKKLDLDRSVRPILRFFEERGRDENTAPRPEDIELAKKLRNSMSRLIGDRSLDELLLLERDNQESFYQLLQTLSRLSTGDPNFGLKNFFRMVRRSLSEKPY
jgi:hypothetical protein